MPDRHIIDRGITVYQQIAEGDDLRYIRNLLCPLRFDFAELIERFADDFELTLDCSRRSPE